MSLITRGSNAKLLWPGLNTIFGLTYKEHTPEFTKLFETRTSTKAYEEMLSMSGFGNFVEKPEGDSVAMDTARQGFVTRISMTTYALGFRVSKEAMSDDQYGQVANLKAASLARSIRNTKDILGHALFNDGFTSTTTADGAYFFSTTHLKRAGGTYKNKLTTDANLSELAVEQAVIDLGDATDDRGNKIAVRPVSLHVPTALEFDSYRIFESIGRVDTANNDVNALRGMNKFPGGLHVHHYFTDSNAWFIKTDVPNGAVYFIRWPDAFDMEPDTDTFNTKFLASFRCGFGIADPLQWFGSAGA